MSELVDKVVAGDIRVVGQLIRDIDDGKPHIRETLKELYPYTGKAHVVGITGAPGVGKSTLVNQMLNHLRRRGKTVGVLAIDPSSPFSGGAILGDRVRMQHHVLDDGVFIRSLATRGQFGGLSQSTRSAIDVLDAMGKDFILVETVGVGQGEVEVVRNAHTTIIVLAPGMGDDIQAIKAGIMEVGDVFVINKADREGADKTLGELKRMIDMDHRKHGQGIWKPDVLKVQAIHGLGVTELLTSIESHRTYLEDTCGIFGFRQRKDRVRQELVCLIKDRVVGAMLKCLSQSRELDEAVEEISGGKLDPYSACERLIFLMDLENLVARKVGKAEVLGVGVGVGSQDGFE